MNDYYMQLGKIDQIKSDGSTVPESMYKAALEFEKMLVRLNGKS